MYPYINSGGKQMDDIKMNPTLERLVEIAKNEELPVYSIAVSTKDGIENAAINPGNPCQDSYSVAKFFCVTAIGMLYDDGKLTPEDNLADIFAEEFAEYGIDSTPWKKVTLHHLMRHRAGFEHGFLDIDVEDCTKYGTQDFLKKALSEPLVYEPGEKSVYTDAAYYLVSRVVAKISGIGLDDFLIERLFNKIDCREVAFSKCPHGHFLGATGLYIRSRDMVKLGRAYLDGGCYNGQRIVSEEWIKMVIENHYELNPCGSGYAKGGMRGQKLYVNFEKDIAIAWHAYDNKGRMGAFNEVL